MQELHRKKQTPYCKIFYSFLYKSTYSHKQQHKQHPFVVRYYNLLQSYFKVKQYHICNGKN